MSSTAGMQRLDLRPRPLSSKSRELLELLELTEVLPNEGTPIDAALSLMNACSAGRFDIRDGANRKFAIDYALVGQRPPETINAFAAEHKGVYCCAVHEYFFLAVVDMAWGLLCDPQFMSSLGDVSSLDGYDYSMPIGSRFLSGEINPPKCPYRQHVATTLIILSLCMAFQHEEIHVLQGHVGALKWLTNEVRLDEQSLAHGTAISMMASQYFEVEADMRALVQFHDPVWQSLLERNFSPFLAPADLITLKWIASALVGSLLLLTNQSTTVPDIAQWGTHPHPYFRARDLANPVFLIQMLRANRVWPDDHLQRTVAGVRAAKEQMRALAARSNQFAVFQELLPPDVDDVAVKWNSQARQFIEDVNGGKYPELANALRCSRMNFE